MQNKNIYILFTSLFLGLTLSSFSSINESDTDKRVKLEPMTQALSVDQQRKLDYYFYEAINAKILDRFDAAYDLLNYCLQIDSTNSAVLYEIGSFHNSIDQKSKALEYYKKAVAYDSDNFYYNASLGSLYLEMQQYTEAVDIYEKLVAQKSGKPDLYLYLSESYRLNGDYQNAIVALDQLENTVGLNERISLQKFQLYSALDNKKKAYAEFQKYIDKYPNEAKYYILLGNIYLQDSKPQEALEVFNKAKAIDPEDPFLITAMAEYYEHTNNAEAAEKEMHAALLSPKLDVESKLNIIGQYVSTLQQKTGSTDRANVLFDTLMIEYPQEPKLNLMYGNLLMLQKKNDEAHAQFKIFAETNPTNPYGWEQLLKTVSPDSIDQSIRICDMAISNLPEEPLYYFYKGIGQFQKKENRLALNTLKKGASYADPEQNAILVSEFYSLSGSLYHELGQRDSAFADFEVALKYNPQNIGVLNNYSYFLALEKKDLDRAEKMSSMTIKAEPTNPTYLDTYGWILFEQGEYVIAKIYLENAVKYSKEKEGEISAEVLEHYGDVLAKLGKEEEALEYWEKAKEKGTSDSKTLDEKIKTKKYVSELAENEK